MIGGRLLRPNDADTMWRFFACRGLCRPRPPLPWPPATGSSGVAAAADGRMASVMAAAPCSGRPAAPGGKLERSSASAHDHDGGGGRTKREHLLDTFFVLETSLDKRRKLERSLLASSSLKRIVSSCKKEEGRKTRAAGEKASAADPARGQAPAKPSPSPRTATGHELDRRQWGALLNAYCYACGASGDVELGLKIVRQLRTVWQKEVDEDKNNDTGPSSFCDLTNYEAMLQMCAKRGQISDIQWIWRKMMDDDVQPSALCYGSVFQCLGHHSEDTSYNLQPFAAGIVEEMSEQSISFSDLFHQSGVYLKDNCEWMLKGLRIVDPAVEPPSSAAAVVVPPDYDCPIIEELNDRRTESLVSPFSDLSLSLLRSKFEEQLTVEEKGYADISALRLAMRATAAPLDANTREKLKADEERRASAKDMRENGGTKAALRTQWKECLRVSLTNRLKRLSANKSNLSYLLKTVNVYPFLNILTVDQCVEILLLEIERWLMASDSFSPSVAIRQNELGTAVMKKVGVSETSGDRRSIQHLREAYDSYLEWCVSPGRAAAAAAAEIPYDSETQRRWCHREAFMTADPRAAADAPLCPWPFPVRMAVGRELLNEILNNVFIDLDKDKQICIHREAKATFPAFYKLFRPGKDFKDVEQIKPHPSLTQLFKQDEEFSQHRFQFSELPMVVPPLPWVSTHRGGFLLHESELIRPSSEAAAAADFSDARPTVAYETPTRKVAPVLDALNILGSTSWVINGAVLDVISEVFLDQDRHSDLLGTLDIPRDPNQLAREWQTLSDEWTAKIEQYRNTESKEERDKYLKLYRDYHTEKEAYKKLKPECYSQWCDVHYRLMLANHFRDDVVFFPHNLDFRGRVYPLPPHFNHMGGDLSRSLLLFSQGKPLGQCDGLRWLKLHAVNLSGQLKRESVDDRLKHADKVLQQIVDSAENPFDGDGWWLKSDEPWQTLATCLEIRNALQSGCPESYVSRLPIHQDGSCNGLQHYAALGRDLLGGKAVNLVPDGKPQDVYSEIASIVERKRSCDAEAGHELARILEGHVQRKVIKQTVMTTVYGVTKYGAKQQIERQLKDGGYLPEDVEKLPLKDAEVGAKYLADKTFESLNEMFEASQEIQAWFTECANVISGPNYRRNVAWETPLGLPVIQPYSRRAKHVRNSLSLQNMMKPRAGNATRPSALKQRNGFPPNFVHSLDSTHMMMTALHLWNAGCGFASVHDCYWTHAASVQKMNLVCRNQFINLHSQNILENLSSQFQSIADEVKTATKIDEVEAAKAELIFKNIPQKGDLDLNAVKDSIYFFS